MLILVLVLAGPILYKFEMMMIRDDDKSYSLM